MNRMKAEDGSRDVGLLAAYRDRLSAGDLFHLDPQRLFSDVYAEVQRYLAIKRPYPEQGDFFKSLSEAAESFDCATSATSIGTISYIGNGVATISGLPQVKSEELVEFPGGVQGMVLSLDRDHADVIPSCPQRRRSAASRSRYPRTDGIRCASRTECRRRF